MLLVGRSRDRIPVASVTGIFLVDTDRTCALGSTQPLKMSTRDSPGGKGGRCVRLTTYHPCSAERQEIRGLNLPGPPWVISTTCCGTDLYLAYGACYNPAERKELTSINYTATISINYTTYQTL